VRVLRSTVDDDDPPSLGIAQAFASMDDAPVETPEQLDRYVNTAGLDALFDTAFGPAEQELLVSFLVEGYQVLLFGDRRLLIRDVDGSSDAD
jgi:hypothetical protein